MKYNCCQKFEYSLFALYTIYIHIFFLQQLLIQGFVKVFSLLRPRNNKMENRKTRR